jgi:hypothetical protein
MLSPEQKKEISSLPAFERLVITEIIQLSGEMRGLTEVTAIASALREAATLNLNAEQIDWCKQRLMVYAEMSKRG